MRLIRLLILHFHYMAPQNKQTKNSLATENSRLKFFNQSDISHYDI